MIAFLNKLFFRGNNITTLFDILKLQPFVLSIKNRANLLNRIIYETDSSSSDEDDKNEIAPIEAPIKENIVENTIVTETTESREVTEEATDTNCELILPKQFDTLFWCLYIIHHK